jgi:hypothetical protein
VVPARRLVKSATDQCFRLGSRNELLALKAAGLRAGRNTLDLKDISSSRFYGAALIWTLFFDLTSRALPPIPHLM